MKRRRRNNFEIMVKILDLCKNPRNQTQVMIRGNLSTGMIHKYLLYMHSLGLLDICNSPTRYVTTQKGMDFIEQWKKLEDFLHPNSSVLNSKFGGAARI